MTLVSRSVAVPPEQSRLHASRDEHDFVDYWEKTVPWTFRPEKISYAERRRLRYSLQDYMVDAIPFGEFKGKRVLEIGSGSGIDSAEFARNGAHVVSLDFTKTGVDTTRDTLKEAGFQSSDVVRAAAQNLPFRDGVFDCVYSFGVLHHIPGTTPIVVELSKKLAPGGAMILMVYNKDSLLYAYSIVFLHRDTGLDEASLLSRYSERIEGCPYTKAYTKQEALSLVAGLFEEVAVEAFFEVIDTPNARKVKARMPHDAQLGWHLLVKAKTPLRG